MTLFNSILFALADGESGSSKILGLEKPMFLLVVSLVVFGVIVFLYVLYFVHGVKKNEVAIIERNGSFKKVKSGGLVFLVPFIDSIADVISKERHVYDFKNELSIVDASSKLYSVLPSLIFDISDYEKFYYKVSEASKLFENNFGLLISGYCLEKHFEKIFELKKIESELTSYLSSKVLDEYGIKLSSIFFKRINN